MTQLHTNSTRISKSPSAAPTSAPAASQDAALAERGQERARVPWYVKVLCRVGIHRGRWEYVAEGHCTQMRECLPCGATKVRTRHKREWRYTGESTCKQARVCGRCDASDKNRTRHEKWGKSYSVGQDTDAHRCERCGVVETWDTSSDYFY